MVLGLDGGSAQRGAPPASPPGSCDLLRAGRRPVSDRGSATVEVALLLPLVLVCVVLVFYSGLAATELLIAQSVAREAARTAAVDDDHAVLRAAREVAGRREVDVRTAPASGARRAGDLVTVEVSLRSHAFDRFGLAVWLPARAVMRVESP
jgi:Flp pilus assembly protein TadG